MTVYLLKRKIKLYLSKSAEYDTSLGNYFEQVLA